MKNDMKSMEASRAAAVAELKAALEELESGMGLTRLVGGHGIQSRVFEFKWSEPALGIDIRLPYDRILSGEEARQEDEAEIGAAIRMAIVLLVSANGLPDVSRIEVACEQRRMSYALYGADGEIEDSGDEWEPLVKRLSAQIDDVSPNFSVIWP